MRTRPRKLTRGPKPKPSRHEVAVRAVVDAILALDAPEKWTVEVMVNDNEGFRERLEGVIVAAGKLRNLASAPRVFRTEFPSGPGAHVWIGSEIVGSVGQHHHEKRFWWQLGGETGAVVDAGDGCKTQDDAIDEVVLAWLRNP